MAGSVLRIQALGTTTEVRADSERLIADLQGLFRYFDLDERPADETATNGFYVQIGDGPECFRLVRHEQRILQTHSYPHLLAHLEFEIHAELTRRAEGCFLIHAGAVALGEYGFLFPGDRGKGKTTLVACLVKNGFEFFSDDTAVLDLHGGRIFPHPRPLNIKGKTQELLQPLGTRLRIASYGNASEPYPARYAMPCPDSIAKRPRPVRFVIFLQRRPGVGARLEPLPRSEAVLGLMHHALNLPRLPKKEFALAARMARHLDPYRMVYGDLERASEEIHGLPFR